MDGFASYEGTSEFLRWWPKALLALALLVATAMTERRHLGDLLFDGVLFQPGQRARLQRAFDYYGYRVV